jgi:protein gp37
MSGRTACLREDRALLRDAITDVIEGKPMAKPTMKSREPHDANWNPWHGCRKVSEACKNCIMFVNDSAKIKNKFRIPEPSTIRLVNNWREPYRLQKQAQELGKRLICSVCMSSDFFIEEADGWREDAWRVIRETSSVVYQIQTKRTHRIADHLPADWGDGYPNVWLGASVEMKKYLRRLDDLRAIPCVLRYADSLGMLESMMPELPDQLDGIGWCIASGEKGCCQAEPRPWDAQWAREVRDVCAERGIPFWFSHVAGRGQQPSTLLDGREYNGMPVISENLLGKAVSTT